MSSDAPGTDQHAAVSLPPGPRLPMAAQTLRAWRATIPFLDAATRRYGPMFTMRALPWGTAVVVNGSELVKEVFSGDPAVYHAGEGNGILAPVVGSRSVLVLDEDQHLQARRTLLPPFHGEAVRAYGRVVEEIVAEEVKRWPLLEPFPLHPRFRSITLEVILRAVIGVSDPGRTTALREVLPECLRISPTIMAMWAIPGLARVGPWRRFRAKLAEANRLLRDEIRDRRRDPQLAERQDVLSRLIAGGQDDDEELRDQIMTLLVAGHETSSTGLAWTFERLLRHPTALARAREGEDGYLDAVVQESLRVRPVLPVVLRQLRAPVSLGGYQLPAGITVMPAITLMHENPALFSEPHRFKPERFLDGDEGGTYAWIPFGGGRRRCLGAAFASFEMRVVLRTILQSAELRVDVPADEPVRNHHITLVPARGARVVRTGWQALAPWPGRQRLTAHAQQQPGVSVGAM
ncbi:MAG TPA: cytochrome P450 [Solirubrobacteraceae bacterium]|nr:cytochrome P450 [Solirubrobacteraceae bacterium]